MKEEIKARIEQEFFEETNHKFQSAMGMFSAIPYIKWLENKLAEAYEEIETLKEKDKMNDYNFYRDDRGEWQRYDD
jgi:hypothetical protein